jgi:two-component system sensor histidine kinase DesK
MDKIKRVLAGPWTPPALGKMPYLWLFSLSYMLFKYLFAPVDALELGLLALTFAVFVPLYLYSYWVSGRRTCVCILLTCLIGALWAPYNLGAATFFIFGAALCAGIAPVRNAYRMLGVVLALAAVVAFTVAQSWIGMLVPVLAGGIPIGLACIKDAALRLSREQLQRKQDEVEHMARIAERERISRDLHDLLGHSLSLIALKAELAGKLAGRDAEACRREIGDIETAARQALAEVRGAVTGYRQSGLAQALAAARASLAAAGVELREEVQRLALAPAAEHVLALALREAVTNVVRHAGARLCAVSLLREQGEAVLKVADDGCLRDVRALSRGNGLTGMQERTAAIGGSLVMRAGAGLVLEVRVPLDVQVAEAAA